MLNRLDISQRSFGVVNNFTMPGGAEALQSGPLFDFVIFLKLAS